MNEATTVKDLPSAGLLSNGRYDVIVEADGRGHAAYEGRLLTPRLALGTCLYVSETGDDPYAVRVWPADSGGASPEDAAGQATLGPGTYRLRRTLGDGVRITCDVCVVPDRDAELRRYVVRNAGKHQRRLMLTVVTEFDGTGDPSWMRDSEHGTAPGSAQKGEQGPGLNDAGRAGHRVDTSFIEHVGGVVAAREHPHGTSVFWLHAFLDAQPTSWETAGEAFFGRTRDAVHPPGVQSGLTATLEPDHRILALQTQVFLEGGAERTVTLAGCAGTSQDSVVGTAESLADKQVLADAFLEAALREQRARDDLKIGPKNADRFHRIAARILHDDPALRMHGPPDSAGAEAAMRRLGLDPDRPLAVCRISDESELHVAHLMLKARAFWESIGLSLQVLFLNDKAGAGANSVQRVLHDAIEAADGGTNGLVLRHADVVPPDDQRAVQRSAQLVLTSDRMDLLRVGR